MVEVVVFGVAATACLVGAVGVVVSRNPVHAALSLVGTLFAIAVLFVAQEAHFLAAVQVIVYAGAIVVLFLFVIMLLGVDQAENLRTEPLGGGQRVAAAGLGVGIVVLVLAALADTDGKATGVPSVVAPLADDRADIAVLGGALFTRYVYAFEITGVLLIIAVVAAVVLARRAAPADEIVDVGQQEREDEVEERIARAEARAAGLDWQEVEPEPSAEGEATEEEVRA
jgi:NADH-quinone oxidoreductase subunit J